MGNTARVQILGKGVSPTISVTEIEGGNRLTIEDINGTKTVDIMNGEKGEDGEPIYVEKAIDQGRIQIGDRFAQQYDVYFTNGSFFTFLAYQGADGADGKDGKDGYTPIKGTDYYTEADKAEMVQAVIDALPDGDEVSY